VPSPDVSDELGARLRSHYGGVHLPMGSTTAESGDIIG
jgi:hypothetical protein